MPREIRRFDCRTPLETAISPVRLEHIAHATDTQRAHNSPGPQVHPRAVHHCQQVHRRWLTQKATARAGLIGLVGKQGEHFCAHRIGSSSMGNKCSPVLCGKTARLVVQLFDQLPVCGGVSGRCVHGDDDSAKFRICLTLPVR